MSSSRKFPLDDQSSDSGAGHPKEDQGRRHGHEAMSSPTTFPQDGQSSDSGSGHSKEGSIDPIELGELGLGREEANLVTVWYLRVKDTMSQNPIVQDQFTSDLFDKINVSLSRSQHRNLNSNFVRYVGHRTKQIDDWTSEFLDRHQFEDLLVLQLSSGLDNRYLRVNRGKDVKWIDVERPKVVDLRKRILPYPEGDYTIIDAFVGEEDDSWLKNIPSNRPTLIVMESLLYYLEPEKGLRLLQRLLGHFQNGNLVFDTVGSVAVTYGALMPLIRNSEARFKWGIDEAEDLLKLDARLVLRDRIYTQQYFGKNHPAFFGGWTPMVSLLPKVSCFFPLYPCVANGERYQDHSLTVMNSLRRMVNFSALSSKPGGQKTIFQCVQQAPKSYSMYNITSNGPIEGPLPD